MCEKVRPCGLEKILDNENYIVLNKQRIHCLRKAEDFIKLKRSVSGPATPRVKNPSASVL